MLGPDAVEFAKQTPWQMAHTRHLHMLAVISEPQEVRKDPANLRLLQPSVVGHLVEIGRAHESGRREHLLDLILMDPWTRDGDQAAALLEGILGLPYHEAMRRHFHR